MGLIAIGLVGLVFSFTYKNGKKAKGKKYEVVRSVDGKLNTYDTIVSIDSDYTPENYLNDLGFSEDNHIKIINLSEHLNELNIEIEEHVDGGEHQMVFVTKDSINCHSISNSDEPHAIFIKKEIRTVKDGKEETVIEINGDDTHFNIDSIIALHSEGHDGKSVHFAKAIIINDSVMEHTGDMKFIRINEDENNKNGQIHKEIKVEIIGHEDSIKIISGDDFKILDENVFIHEMGDDAKTFDVEMTRGHENFTIVLVTEINNMNEPKNRKIEKESGVDLKVYPNPARSNAQLELNFNEKATTVIQVTDMNGKIVYNSNLGELSGTYRHEFDLTDWSKGVYIIDIQHGDERLKEKLIVE